MKNLFIGVVIGLVLGSTGSYVALKEKVKKAATIENASKVVDATAEFGQKVQGIFKQVVYLIHLSGLLTKQSVLFLCLCVLHARIIKYTNFSNNQIFLTKNEKKRHFPTFLHFFYFLFGRLKKKLYLCSEIKRKE